MHHIPPPHDEQVELIVLVVAILCVIAVVFGLSLEPIQ